MNTKHSATKLWKQFALVQLFIVGGLTLENSPSLTRLATENFLTTSFVSLNILVCFIILFSSYVKRYWLNKGPLLSETIIAYITGFAGINIGAIAAIISNSAVYSYVLVIGYLWYSYLYISAAHQIAKEEKERSREHVSQT